MAHKGMRRIPLMRINRSSANDDIVLHALGARDSACASSWARLRSAELFANPESCTWPRSVSTLIDIALTTGSSANFALTRAVTVASSTYSPTVRLVARDGATRRGENKQRCERQTHTRIFHVLAPWSLIDGMWRVVPEPSRSRLADSKKPCAIAWSIASKRFERRPRGDTQPLVHGGPGGIGAGVIQRASGMHKCTKGPPCL